MGNNSLQQLFIAIISASIVEREVLVCYFETQQTGQSVNVIINLVYILTHAGSVGFSYPYIP